MKKQEGNMAKLRQTEKELKSKNAKLQSSVEDL